MQDKPGMLPEGLLFLFVLQCIVSFFARPDPYDVLDIVNKYLAVARMSSVQGFLHRVDDSLDGDPAHDDVDLDLGKEPRFHRSAAEVFRVAFLHPVSEDVRDCQPGDADLVKSCLDSTAAKPRFMKNTRTAASTTQMVSTIIVISIIDPPLKFEACILHTAVKYTPLCMVISCFTKNLTRLCR